MWSLLCQSVVVCWQQFLIRSWKRFLQENKVENILRTTIQSTDVISVYPMSVLCVSVMEFLPLQKSSILDLLEIVAKRLCDSAFEKKIIKKFIFLMVVCFCFVKKWTSCSGTGAVSTKASFPGPPTAAGAYWQQSQIGPLSVSVSESHSSSY